jgi:predicted nucleic acid-binding protein
LPVIDASVWVAINRDTDPAHSRCMAWLESVLDSNDRLVAPTLLVAEVAGALRRLTRQQAIASAVVEELFTLGTVELIPLDRERARRAAGLAAASGVCGADAVYLALAQELEESLVTLDRQQAERGARLVEVRSP